MRRVVCLNLELKLVSKQSNIYLYSEVIDGL